jgi:hypothetical protein
LIFHFAHFEDAFLGRSTKAYLLEHWFSCRPVSHDITQPD